MTANLGVLVPTKNRPKRIRQLLSQFSLYHRSDELIIYIAENCIASELLDIIAKYESLNIVHLPSEKNYDTAEENVFRAWDSIKTEYVWILGDDDLIVPNTVDQLLDECLVKKNQIFKFNSVFIGKDGEFSQYQTDICNKNEVDLHINDFIVRTGFWHSAAGFSTWVIPQKLINSRDALDWVYSSITPIYSHVTFFVKTFSKQSICYKNLNLVQYRVNGYVEGDKTWQNYARKNRIPRFMPWTFSFIQQIYKLEEINCLETSYYKEVVGNHIYADPFSEFNSMINLIILQILRDLTFEKFKFNQSQILTISKFLSEHSNHANEFLVLLDEYLDFLSSKLRLFRFGKRLYLIKSLYKQSQMLNEAMQNIPLFQCYLGCINGYGIYRYNNRYISSISGNSSSILRKISVDLTSTKDFYVYDKHQDLVSQLLRLPRGTHDSKQIYGIRNKNLVRNIVKRRLKNMAIKLIGN